MVDIANALTSERVDDVRRWANGDWTISADDVAREEPLEIRARGRAVTVTMRTPGHDAELAAGFFLSEGLIRRREDVLKIEHCNQNDDGNVLNVLLAPDVYVDFEKLTRHVFASSSCGLCGRATIDSVRGQFPAITRDDVRVTPESLQTMPETMRAAQTAFDKTGGLHAAALFTPAGELVVLREDVGRHNATDKVLGHTLMSGIDSGAHVLLVSGRVSFEIVQKALAAGVAVIAAVSAPSTLAIEFARENGQTLIGFLRPGRMNVYAGPARLLASLSQPEES